MLCIQVIPDAICIGKTGQGIAGASGAAIAAACARDNCPVIIGIASGAQQQVYAVARAQIRVDV